MPLIFFALYDDIFPCPKRHSACGIECGFEAMMLTMPIDNIARIYCFQLGFEFGYCIYNDHASYLDLYTHTCNLTWTLTLGIIFIWKYHHGLGLAPEGQAGCKPATCQEYLYQSADTIQSSGVSHQHLMWI